MHRSTLWLAQGATLLVVATSAAAPKHPPPPVQRNAAVKLWLDTAAGNPCEHMEPSSGEWTVHNQEQRTVRVTVRRTLTHGSVTHEDVMKDTLEPGEQRELGCEASEDGHAALTLISAVY